MRSLGRLSHLGHRALSILVGHGDTIICDRESQRIVIRRRRYFRLVTRTVASGSIERVELLARGPRRGRSHIRIRCVGGDRIEVHPSDRPQGHSLAIACALATFCGHPLHMVHQ